MLNDPRWVPCPWCCEEFWCRAHHMHAFECPCPAIDEMDYDPYTQMCKPSEEEPMFNADFLKKQNLILFGSGFVAGFIVGMLWFQMTAIG